MAVCGAPDCGRLHIAVSTTNDPGGTWNVYAFQFQNVFPDYPGLGLSDDKITISYNIFIINNDAFVGVQTLVLQKSDLLAGPPTPVNFFASPVEGGLFTVRPAHSLSGTATQYMASVDFNTATQVHLFAVTGTPDAANVAISNVANPGINTLTSPPDAQQQGTMALISTNDNRILEAVWRNNRLWLSANAACVPSGDSTSRPCLKLIEIETGSNAVVQDIVFGSAGDYLYYPAIRTDSNANLHVVFTRSSSSVFAEARVAGRRSSDAPNTINGSTLLKVGEIAYDPPGFTSQRWGDYSGAAVDPSDPTQIWVVGEYAKDDISSDWGTWIGKFQYLPVAITVTDGSVAFGTVALSTTINTTPTGVNDMQTVSVASGPADLFIKTTAFSDGVSNTWALGPANGANQVKWEFSKDGTTWTTFTDADMLFTLDSNVSTGATRNVYLQLVMPTSTGSVNQHSVTVTIVAVAP